MRIWIPINTAYILNVQKHTSTLYTGKIQYQRKDNNENVNSRIYAKDRYK